MKEIPLTQGKVALVDDCDFEYLSQWKWCLFKCKKTAYAKRLAQSILMHRVVLERMGVNNFEQCDHEDGNGLNNQRSNLRPVTNQQNGCNRGKNKNNTSGLKGVCWHKGARKWIALTTVKGQRKYLGLFIDPIEAAKAYNEAAIKYHGEFAKVNAL